MPNQTRIKELELEKYGTVVKLSETDFMKALEKSRAGALKIPIIKPYHGTFEQRMMIYG
jgi:hypothetical protein